MSQIKSIKPTYLTEASRRSAPFLSGLMLCNKNTFFLRYAGARFANFYYSWKSIIWEMPLLLSSIVAQSGHISSKVSRSKPCQNYFGSKLVAFLDNCQSNRTLNQKNMLLSTQTTIITIPFGIDLARIDSVPPLDFL